jgi:hypothetical protein
MKKSKLSRLLSLLSLNHAFACLSICYNRRNDCIHCLGHTCLDFICFPHVRARQWILLKANPREEEEEELSLLVPANKLRKAQDSLFWDFSGSSCLFKECQSSGLMFIKCSKILYPNHCVWQIIALSLKSVTNFERVISYAKK